MKTVVNYLKVTVAPGCWISALTHAHPFKLLIVCYSSFLLQNELAILEFIHNLVETLDRYFSNVVSLGKKCNLFFL